MSFLNDYKNRGGRVSVGTDAGFIYNLFGFSYVVELELLREAGFHPLEVIRSATMTGAQTLFEPKGKRSSSASFAPVCWPISRSSTRIRW